MPTRVKANVGYTVNMGDFNSIRFDFGIEDDKRPDETASEAMDRCFKFCWAKLEPRVEEARRESQA